VFVNPDLNAPPLGTVLGDLPSMVLQTGLNLDAIKVRERRSYAMEANWKVVVENYLECYHCPVAHPAFSDLIDVRDYHIQTFDYFSTQSAAMRRGAKNGHDNPYPIGAGVEEGFYVFLWPNFTVNIYPGPGNVSLNLILPLDENHTLMLYEFCFVDAISESESREFVDFVDQVQREDTALCESVQRGLRSGFFHRGRLMLSRESALQHFQQLVHRELSIDALGGAASAREG
jgi:choline monooxygenase